MPHPKQMPEQNAGLDAGGLYARKRARNSGLLLLLALGLFFCGVLARPFVPAITWALALAVIAHPFNLRLERVLRPSLAALMTVIITAVILLAPGAFLVSRVIDEARGTLSFVAQHANSQGMQQVADRLPLVGKVLDWIRPRFDPHQELQRAAGVMASQASALVSGSIRALTQFVLMLVALYFFLRDRKMMLHFLRRLVPLSPSEADTVFGRVRETIRAILYGNLVVKLVQGTLGGLMFWSLGLPAPVLCGAAMALCAMIPIVGAGAVWVPAVIFFLVQTSWVKAIVLIAWGSLVVSLIDNVLYPLLVATELRLHTLAVLIAVLGGLIAFGLAGVVLGPVILAVTVALLEIWRLRHGGNRLASEQGTRSEQATRLMEDTPCHT